jgi:diaminopimelate epimerase
VRLELPTGTLELDIVAVDLGNPHCVLFVPDEQSADVTALGPLLERHAHFPKGANVEFAAPDGRRLGLRVWERGVGETASCGSGACAAAAAAISTGRMDPPVEVEQRGGWVLVEWDERDGLWLSGPVEDLIPTGLGAAVSGGGAWTSA